MRSGPFSELALLWLCALLTGCADETRSRRPSAAGGQTLADAVSSDAEAVGDGGDAGSPALDASGEQPVVVPDGVPIEEFCALYAAVIRDQELRCSRSSAREAAEITDFVQQRCERQFLPAAQAGVIAYDAAAMGDCLEQVLDSCEIEAVLNSESCGAARQGTLADGVPCYASSECDEGFCPTASQCPAICMADAGPLESCLGRHCVRGTYCNAGNACMWERREGDPCTFDLECVPGLTCVYADVEGRSDGSCRPKGRSGAACGPTAGLCEEGFRCERPEASSPDQAGECLQLIEERLGVVGEACDADRPCQRGAFCSTPMWSLLGTEGECRPRAQEGQACPVGGEDLIWFYRGCDAALCHAVAGVIRGVCRSTALGEPCAAASIHLDLGTTTRSYIEWACSGLDQVCGGGEAPRCELANDCARP